MKNYVLLFLILMCTMRTMAQVNTLPFIQSLDTYQVINGTVVDMPNEDDIFHPNLPLGFTFVYNGNATSKFGICTNGFIVMDSLNHSGLWIPGGSSTNQASVLMADLRNSNPGGTIEYVTLGTAPNRVCIIQWKDYGIFGVPYCHLNAQIRLFEGTNCIQYYYGTNAYSIAAGKTFFVGLTGTTMSDFNSRTTALDWTMSTAASSFTTQGMFMNPLSVIPPGLVFSFGTCPPAGSLFSYITGQVYNDQNGNGSKDAGENGLANILIHESTQNYYSSTDSNGNYTLLFVDSALTYQVSATPLTYWNITSTPTTYTLQPLTQSVSGIDFGMQATPNVHDLRIVANSGNVPWPNATVHFYATYSNHGTVVEPGDSIFCLKDSHYAFVSAVPAPALVSGDSIIWTYSNLAVNAHSNIHLVLHADTLITAGDTLHTYWKIDPTAGDAFVADNTDTNQQICISSFDPNFKEVSPDGQIANTQQLDYVIHFQNTGTASASNIFVHDTLDANVDMNTLQWTGSSHPMYYQIDGNRHITFIFAGINLPDSNSNEPLSHGWVSYRVYPKNTLSTGNKIHNRASIIFDYNTPVLTNTTENIIGESIPTVISAFSERSKNLMLYPNPAEAEITLIAATNMHDALIRISDLTGHIWLSQAWKGEGRQTLSLQQFPSGMYFVDVTHIGKHAYVAFMKR